MRVISSDRHAQRELLGHGITTAADPALCQEQNVHGLLGTPRTAAAPGLGSRLCSRAPTPWPAAGRGSRLLPYPKIPHQSHYRGPSPPPTQNKEAPACPLSMVLPPSPGRQTEITVAIVTEGLVEALHEDQHGPALLTPGSGANMASRCLSTAGQGSGE